MSASRDGLYSQPEVQKFPRVQQAYEESGKLIVKLVKEEDAKLVEAYLKATKTDFRLENDIENSFDYEYEANTRSFIITPQRVTIAGLLWDFGLNGLIDRQKGPKPKFFKDLSDSPPQPTA